MSENFRNEQIDKINDILCVTCNNSEFYKGIYQKLGVTFPIKIGDFSDLKALPVIKKEAFRSALALNSDTLRTRMFKNEDVFIIYNGINRPTNDNAF
ncbi:hypothetical protein O9992_10375 [Vibrio lentus]|nr:hypothetical protein [Vibrio lentus]